MLALDYGIPLRTELTLYPRLREPMRVARVTLQLPRVSQQRTSTMILVVGATGNLGGITTRALLAQGKSVRILIRPQSAYQALEHAGAQIVVGDLKERGSLDVACHGVDTVITTANSAARDGADTMETVDLAGNRHLIDAAKTAGVRQFIFVSVLGADPISPIPFLQAKGTTEAYLRSSGVPYTMLAPNGYMEVMIKRVVGMPAKMGRPVTIVGGGNRKHSFISVSDVAAFILAAIGNPAAINQRLVLGGPQALSLRDAVAVHERVFGHHIQINSVAPGESVPELPQTVASLLAGLDTYDSPIDMTETAATFGVQLTPLEEILHRAVICGLTA